MTQRIIERDFKIAEAILRDAKLKSMMTVNNEETMALLKILKAREENYYFELELAKRICGDNPNYPYRSSSYLTQFFRRLGFDYEHDGSTRRFWVKDVLLELDVSQIVVVIQKGLFNKDDYKSRFLGNEADEEFSPDEFLKDALDEFRRFIDESSTVNEPISLSKILNLHPSFELLFKSKPKTKDENLNGLINDAKNRFFNDSDLNIALEKLWDAFERLKTYFDNDKKNSIDILVNHLSIDLEKQIIEKEFKELTIIGNDYQIRHHERGKKAISDPNQISYLFFRMLSLIDFAVTTIMNLPDKTSNR